MQAFVSIFFGVLGLSCGAFFGFLLFLVGYVLFFAVKGSLSTK